MDPTSQSPQRQCASRRCWAVLLTLWLVLPAGRAAYAAGELPPFCQRAAELLGSPGIGPSDIVKPVELAERLLHSPDGLAPRLRAVISPRTLQRLDLALTRDRFSYAPDALAEALNEACLALAPDDGLHGPRLAEGERLVREWAGNAVNGPGPVVWQTTSKAGGSEERGRCGGSSITVGALGERDVSWHWPFAVRGALLTEAAAARRATAWLQQAGVDTGGWEGPEVKTTDRGDYLEQEVRWQRPLAHGSVALPNEIKLLLAARGVLLRARVFDPPSPSSGPRLTRDDAIAAARRHFGEPQARAGKADSFYRRNPDGSQLLCWSVGLQLHDRQVVATVDDATGVVLDFSSPAGCCTAPPLPLPQFRARLESFATTMTRWTWRLSGSDAQAEPEVPLATAQAIWRLVVPQMVEEHCRQNADRAYILSAWDQTWRTMVSLNCDASLARWRCRLVRLDKGTPVENQCHVARLTAAQREEVRRLLGLPAPPRPIWPWLLPLPLVVGVLAWRWRRARLAAR